MSQALYRTYRPQNFTAVVNQEHIKLTLQNEIKTGAIAHAYLFCGPRGIGKTTLARIFAKTINCEKRKKGTAEPCETCPSCSAITGGSELDVIEMDAATHTQVDKVRANIIESARLLPSHSPYKVFIIDEVHMLSTSSFNALLKIIEEPPPHVIFILATTEAYKVPATIISRCQRFDFKRISIDLMVKRLSDIAHSEKRDIDIKVLEAIAGVSDGSLRDAESLLGEIITLDKKKITYDMASLVLPVSDSTMVRTLAGHIVHKRAREGVDVVSEAVDGGIDLTRFTDELIELWRTALLVKIGACALKQGTFDSERESWLAEHLTLISVRDLETVIELAFTARSELQHTTILQLPLEVMVVKACLRDGEDNTTATGNPPPGNSQETMKKTFSSREGSQKAKGEESSKRFSEILEKWQEVVEHARVSNTTLGVIISLTKPIKLTKNILTVGLAYQLHLNRLKHKKIQLDLEKILAVVYGSRITVEPVLIERTPQEQRKTNADISGLAAAFGGRVV